MNCSKCGTVNAPNSTFCVGCGQSLSINNTEQPVVAPVQPAPAASVEMPALAQPAAPVAPAAPVEMPAPAAPVAPVAPTPVVEPTPAAPVAPVQPAAPVVAPNPVAPTVEPAPVAPAPVAPAPAVPVQPVPAPAPVTPEVAPAPVAQPAQPVTPVTPVAPVQQPMPGQVAVPTAAPAKKPFNKKVLIIAIIAGIVLVAGVVAAILILNGGGAISEKEAAKLILDPKKPIKIEKDDKYGYISHKGKELITPKYDYADEFYGDYAVVGVENTDPETSSYIDYKYQIIDQKGKEQLKESVSFEPEFYGEYNIWVIDNVLYNSKLKAITKEDIEIDYIGAGYLEYTNYEQQKVGIMDYKGKSIWHTDNIYIDSEVGANIYDEKDLYAVVKTSNLDDKETWEVISLKKKKSIYTLETNNDDSLEVEDNGIVSIEDDDYDTHTWLYFKDGKLKYEIKDENIEEMIVYDYDNQILRLDYGYDYDEYEYVYKYYDVKEEKLTSEKPANTDDADEQENDLYELYYGFKTFESSDKYGLMAGDKILVPANYDDVEFLSAAPFVYMRDFKNQELVIFEKDDKMILYNVKNKKEVATFDSTYVSDSESSSFLKFSKEEDYDTVGYIVYNLISGKQMEFDEDAEISLRSNYIKVETDSSTIYYNTDLEKVYEE